MAVIAKLKGKKMVCGTEKPLEGTITVYDYIVKHNLLFKVKLCIPAHDE